MAGSRSLCPLCPTIGTTFEEDPTAWERDEVRASRCSVWGAEGISYAGVSEC